MAKVTKSFCWHQNFVPWGLSGPCPGQYTCIKSWKKLYKIRLQRHFFETCNKWPKWQDGSVDIKTLSPGGCLPLPWGYIKSLKKCIKADFKEIFWNLQQMNEVARRFCLHQNFVPWGLSASAPGLYTCIKSRKKLYKIRLQRDFFENCNKWLKWQDVLIDIKILYSRSCQPLPRGYIHV